MYCHFILLPIFLITIILDSRSNRLLPFISFNSLTLFLKISPILSFGAWFFVSPFWLSRCICFYVLDRSSVTLSSWCGLMEWAFCGVLWCNLLEQTRERERELMDTDNTVVITGEGDVWRRVCRETKKY